MADIESNIRIGIDATDALSTIRNLQRQISAFHQQLNTSGSAANAAMSQNMQRTLMNNINATRKFSASLTTVQSSAEAFSNSLDRNKLSMGQYFRFGMASTKSFGNFFRDELGTINKAARENVKTLQTQYIKVGRDVNGVMQSIKVRPLTLDMQNYGTQVAVAAQKQAILNQVLKQGSTNLLNFGKNTQWAGRQLMVGFTLPLGVFASTAAKVFMQVEKQAIRFKRVYGDAFSAPGSAEKALDQMKSLASEFTKYGVAVEKTLELAADAAQMGLEGSALRAQVTNATRLAVLGEIEQQEALETTISLTNAFGIATEDLAKKIDFLNAVENQTVTAISDLTIAIPKAGPVVQQLGGDVEDLAFFLTAMKEGGINASEGANALKSGLASMINPAQKTKDMLNGLGISIDGIVEGNAGDVKGLVVGMANALDTLDPLNRARAIEQLFGKFQFSRISTLFQNVIKEGTQASRVLALTQASSAELSVMAERELQRVEDSPAFKFQKSLEDIKKELVPLGQEFLKLVTPLVSFATDMLKQFNTMSEGSKQFVMGLIGFFGLLAPVALMTFGLFANGVANIIKGFTVVRSIFNGVAGAGTDLANMTQYMTQEQLEAASAAGNLGQTHVALTNIFSSEAAALQQLIAAYTATTASMAAMNAVVPIPRVSPTAPPITRIPGTRRVQSPGGTIPGSTGRIPGYKTGVLSVPGPKGAGDVVPAMLAPGEAVIPAKQSQKYAGFIQDMINDDLPGYRFGRIGAKLRGMKVVRGKKAESVPNWNNLVPDNASWSIIEGLVRTLTNRRGTYGPSSTQIENQGAERFLRGAGKKVAVRMFADDLIGALGRGDKRYQTVFERGGTSRGSGDAAGGQRAIAEEKMFGLGQDADPSARPAYGFLFNRDIDLRPGTPLYTKLSGKHDPNDRKAFAQRAISQSTRLMNEATYRYGNVAMVLKNKALRGRTTVTQGDSINSFMNQYPTPAPFGTRNKDALAGSKSNRGNLDFFEAQIMGGFNFSDVKRIVTTEPQTALAIQKALQQAGIQGITVGMPKLTMLQRIQGLLLGRGPYETRMPRMQPDGRYAPDPRKTKFYNKGVLSVPGPKGKGDIVPAMLSPGEAVIPAAVAKRNRGFIAAMIAGKIPGFAQGAVSVAGNSFGISSTETAAIKIKAEAELFAKTFPQSMDVIEETFRRLAGDLKVGVESFRQELAVVAENLGGIPAGKTADAIGLDKSDIRGFQGGGTIDSQFASQRGELGTVEVDRAKGRAEVERLAMRDYMVSEEKMSLADAETQSRKTSGMQGNSAGVSRGHVSNVGMLGKMFNEEGFHSDVTVATPQIENALTSSSMMGTAAKPSSNRKAYEASLADLAGKGEIDPSMRASLIAKLDQDAALTEQELIEQGKVLQNIFDDRNGLLKQTTTGFKRYAAGSIAGAQQLATQERIPGVGERSPEEIARGQKRLSKVQLRGQEKFDKSSPVSAKKGISLMEEAGADTAKGLVDGYKQEMQQKSPSKKMFDMGKDSARGLLQGLKEGFKDATKATPQIGSQQVTGNIDNAIAAGRPVGMGPVPGSQVPPPPQTGVPPAPLLPGVKPFQPILPTVSEAESTGKNFGKHFVKQIDNKMSDMFTSGIFSKTKLAQAFKDNAISDALQGGATGGVILTDRSGKEIDRAITSDPMAMANATGADRVQTGEISPNADNPLAMDVNGNPILDRNGNPLTVKDNDKQIKRADNARKRGMRATKAFGALGTASMVAGMASGMEGQVGQIAQGAMGPLMALSGIAPILMALPGPLAALVAVVGIGVFAFMKWNEMIAKSREEGRKLGDALSLSTNKLIEMSKITGTVSATEERRAVQEDQLSGESSKTRKFGMSFLESGAGQQIIQDVNTLISSGLSKDESAAAIGRQLSTAIAQGVLTSGQARSIASALGEELKDYNFSAEIVATITSIVGPNGEKLEKEPLKVLLEVQKQSMDQLEGMADIAFNPESVDSSVKGRLQKSRAEAKQERDIRFARGGFDGFAAGFEGFFAGESVEYTTDERGNVVGNAKEISDTDLEFIVEREKESAKLQSASVQLGINQIQQNQQLLDSLEKQYSSKEQQLQQQLKLTTDATKRKSIEKEISDLQNNRVKDVAALNAANAASMTQITKMAKDFDPKVFGEAIKTSVLGQYEEDNPLRAFAEDAVDRLNSLSDSSFKTTLQLQFASGDLSIDAVNRLLGLEESSPEVVTKFNAIVDERGVADGGQLMNLIMKAGIDDANIERYMTIFTEFETEEDFDTNVEALAQIGNMRNEYGFTIDLNSAGNEGTLEEVAGVIEALKDEPEEITYERVLELAKSDPAKFDGIVDNWKTIVGDGKTIKRSVIIDFSATGDMNSIYRLLIGKGKSRAQIDQERRAMGDAAFLGTYTNEAAAADVADGKKNEDDPNEPKGEDKPTGGDKGADPAEEMLKDLKRLRNYTIDVTKDWKELQRVLGKGLNMTALRGEETLLLERGLSAPLASYFAGLDEASKKLYFTVSKGRVVFTKQGEVMKQAFDERAIGRVVVSLQGALTTVKQQGIATRKLAAAGLSYKEAAALAADAEFAAAVSSNKNAREIAEIVRLKKEELALAEKLTALTDMRVALEANAEERLLKLKLGSFSSINQRAIEANSVLQEGIKKGLQDTAEFGKLLVEEVAKVLAADLKAASDAVVNAIKQVNLTSQVQKFLDSSSQFKNAAVQSIILSDSDLSTLVKAAQETGGALGKEFYDRLNQLLKDPNALAAVFDEGMSKAMDAFSVQEQAIELKFKVDTDFLTNPENGIIPVSERQIADLQYRIDDFEAAIQGLGDQEEEINEKYEKRFKTLDKIQELNERASSTASAQLDIATALSRGDVGSAARSIQQFRSSQAQTRLEAQRKLMEKSKEREIASLVSKNGLTRKENEEAIKNLKDQIFDIEEQTLEPAQRSLQLATDARDIAVSNVTVLGQTRLEWDSIQSNVDLARINNEKFVTSLTSALGIATQLKAAYEALGKVDVSKAPPAPVPPPPTAVTPPTGTPETSTVVTPTETPADEVFTTFEDLKDKGGTHLDPSLNPRQDEIDKLNNAIEVTRWRVRNDKTLSKAVVARLKGMNQDRIEKLRKIPGAVISNGMRDPKDFGPLSDHFETPQHFAVGGIVPAYLRMGGLLPYKSEGGSIFKPLGTDTVPAMLTPGEFVVRKYAVDNFGVDRLSAINSGTYSGESVYNYSVNVNVKSDANPEQIARAVMGQIKQVDSQRIRGNRFNG